MAAEKSGEFRGKTVEAAINNGLIALGVAASRSRWKLCGLAAGDCLASAPKRQWFISL